MRKCTLALTLLLVAGCNGASPRPEDAPSNDDNSKDRTVQDWINELQSDNEVDRLTAAVGLGELGPKAKRALPALIAALHDSDYNVRLLAAWALVYVDPDGHEVLGPLSQATRDSNLWVRLKAVESLARIGPVAEPAIPELERLLKDSFPVMRSAAAEALAHIGPGAESAVPKLESVAEFDEDDVVRKSAADAIRVIGTR